jgi:ribokinase
VGSDALGAQAIAGFAREKIRTNHVIADRHHPSGVALIFVARGGQNCIAVASGANGQLCPGDLTRAKAAFARADVILLQLEIPLETVVAAVRLAARQRVPVILNPAPARPLPDSLLRQMAILTPNESEAETLTGMKVTGDASARRAAERLRARGARAVIITRGARGAFICDEAGGRRVPAYKVKAVDTTAAGDIFNGALAVALGEGRGLDAAVRFACAAAALSTTQLGAQPSAPTHARIQRLAG